MAENFRENPTALRHVILFKFLEGEPILDAYMHFCKVMGDEIMAYSEFEFWFMRFAKGNFDLSYDRSSDPKTRSLSDMPVNIFEKIVKELELTDRLIVRKVCKGFQYLIDSWDPGFKKIRIDLDLVQSNYIYFDDISFEVGNQSQISFYDLAAVLKNPKLQLDEFKIHFATPKHSEKIVSMLKSLNRKIRTKSVKIRTYFTAESDIKVVSYLDENVLEDIVLKKKGYRKSEKFNSMIKQISRFDQCKTAMITIDAHTNLPEIFPSETLRQFRRFTLDCKLAYTVMDVMRFINVLTNSADLKVFNLKSEQRFGITSLKNRLDRRFEVTEHPDIRRFPIPNSNEFFEVELNDHHIRVERTS